MSEVAVVTGASRGIGAAVAGALADVGFFVVGTATSEAGAAAIAATLGERGSGQVLDVTDADAVDAFAATVADGPGVPHVLVNNAGITRDNLFVRMKPEEWDAVIAANLTGSFRVCRALARSMMRARAGRIINISSVVAAMGNAGQANYCASKGGIEALTRSLARELGARGITVNAIAPGFIETDMTAELGDDQKAALAAQIPLGTLGSPADVAAAVVFLAGSGAGYITGETLHVNGGMYMS